MLLSTVGAAADSPMELVRMKYAAEQRATSSGVPYTIVRATAFLELWIEVLEQTAGRSGRPLMFRRGQNPINFVSVSDVAALAERAVLDPATRENTLEIGGPENLTFAQLAQAVQRAAGRTTPPRHVPPSMLRLMANTVGRVKPQLGRQARAALVMDSADLAFNRAPMHNLDQSFRAPQPLKCSPAGTSRCSRLPTSDNHQHRDDGRLGRADVSWPG